MISPKNYDQCGLIALSDFINIIRCLSNILESIAGKTESKLWTYVHATYVYAHVHMKCMHKTSAHDIFANMGSDNLVSCATH